MNARLDFFKGKSGSNSILDGVRELEESQEANFGLVMEGTSAEYMLHDRCDFYTVGSLATRFYSFGLPKGKIVFNLLMNSVNSNSYFFLLSSR